MQLLISKYSSGSDKGYIDKGSFLINGVKCLVKNNTEVGYQSFAEVLGSRIFSSILNFEVLRYELVPYGYFKEWLKVEPEYKYVTYSKKYKYTLKNYSKEVRNLRNKKVITDYKLNFDGVFEFLGLDMNQFYGMLIGDALIGNNDRHWNNFDIYYDERDQAHLGPILDFGQSLLADVDDVNLNNYRMLKDYNKAKPLEHTHDKQIKTLISEFGLRKVIKTSYKEFESFILNDNEDLFSTVSKVRADTVKRYVLERYKEYAEQFEM